MAKTKPLTRFYVRHGTVNAELFAVRQRGCGDLVIKLKPIFDEASFLGRQQRILEEKYSVHVSPESTGHTFSHTMVMADVPDKREVSFIECGGQPLLASLYSRRHTSLPERLFGMRVQMKDTRVRVAEFDITKNSLITHVLVATRDAYTASDFDLPWNVLTHRFRLFDIHIVYCFIPYGAPETGDHAQAQSSFRQSADEAATEANQRPLKTMKPEGVKRLCDGLNNAFCHNFVPRTFLETLNRLGNPSQEQINAHVAALGRAVRVVRDPVE